MSRVTAKTGRRSSLEPRKGFVERAMSSGSSITPPHSEARSQQSTRPPGTVVSFCGFPALAQCTEESQWYGMAVCCGRSISRPWHRGLGRWDLIVVIGKKDWRPELCSEPTRRVTGHCQFTPLPLKMQADRFLRWKLREDLRLFFSAWVFLLDSSFSGCAFFPSYSCLLLLKRPHKRGQAEPVCPPSGWGTLGLCAFVWKGKFGTAECWPVSPQLA